MPLWSVGVQIARREGGIRIIEVEYQRRNMASLAIDYQPKGGSADSKTCRIKLYGFFLRKPADRQAATLHATKPCHLPLSKLVDRDF